MTAIVSLFCASASQRYKSGFRLSAFISKPQNKESACDRDQQSNEDGSAEKAAVKPVAELAQIHLQMLRAGAVAGAVDECLGVSGDPVEPLQMLAVRVKVLSFVNVTVFQMLGRVHLEEAVHIQPAHYFHKTGAFYRCFP